MNKLTELKQLPTDTSGRWVKTSVATNAIDTVVDDIIANLEAHSTAFDGDVGRGVKTAARLVRELYKETP